MVKPKKEKSSGGEWAELIKRLGVDWRDEHHLQAAFVHGSYLNEHGDQWPESNERLEFLGDAVLELVVTEHLYHQFKNKPEGELTNLRSAVVNGKNLAQIGRLLELGKQLLLSHGEELSGGRDKGYLLANTIEAIIGAIYLDSGYEAAAKFVTAHILSTLPNIIKQGSVVDPKSQLQELAQEKHGFTPEYKLLHESGPDHQKTFVAGVYLQDNLIGEGSGHSKQEAERAAAADALAGSKDWAV